MKRIFLITILSVIGLWANAEVRHVGYCGPSFDKGTAVGKIGSSAEMSGAIIVTGEMLNPFVGAKAKGIRIYLSEPQHPVEDFTAWIRNSLEGENLTSGVLPEIQEGWTEVDFDTPVAIDGTAMAVGFTYRQSKNPMMATGVKSDAPDSFWFAKQGNWENYQESKGLALCLELVLEDERFPTCDVAVTSVKCVDNPVRFGEKTLMEATVTNLANAPVAGVACHYEVGNFLSETQIIEESLAYRESRTLSFEIDSSVAGLGINIPLMVYAELSGDLNEDNDRVVYGLTTYDNCFERKTLIEEFTSEECPNCPRAIEALKTAMESGYDVKTSVIAHHVGYFDDILTVEKDRALVWFYGEDGSFAPALMLDRKLWPDTSDGYPIMNFGYADTFMPQIDRALESPAFVAIRLSPSYDAVTRTLSLGVEMEKLPEFDVVCQAPRLNVVLTEDEVDSKNQAGYSSSFKHSHAYRDTVSEYWGDSFEWEGSSASCQYEYVLDEGWNPDNVKIVAFVHEYDPKDRNACEVFNSANIGLNESKVSTLEGGTEILSEEYYTVEGLRVSPGQRGLTIRVVRYTDGNRRSSLHYID